MAGDDYNFQTIRAYDFGGIPAITEPYTMVAQKYYDTMKAELEQLRKEKAELIKANDALVNQLTTEKLAHEATNKVATGLAKRCDALSQENIQLCNKASTVEYTYTDNSTGSPLPITVIATTEGVKRLHEKYDYLDGQYDALRTENTDLKRILANTRRCKCSQKCGACEGTCLANCHEKVRELESKLSVFEAKVKFAENRRDALEAELAEAKKNGEFDANFEKAAYELAYDVEKQVRKFFNAI